MYFLVYNVEVVCIQWMTCGERLGKGPLDVP